MSIQLHCASSSIERTRRTHADPSPTVSNEKHKCSSLTGPDNEPSCSAAETIDGWFPRQRRVNSSEDLQPSINSIGGAPLFSPHQQRRNRLRLNGIDTAHVGWATYTMTHLFIVRISLKPPPLNASRAFAKLEGCFFFVCLFVSISLLIVDSAVGREEGSATLTESQFSLCKKKSSQPLLKNWSHRCRKVAFYYLKHPAILGSFLSGWTHCVILFHIFFLCWL